MDAFLVLRFGAIVGLLLLSGMFSGSESALFSLGAVKVRRLEEEGGGAGERIARLLRSPRQLIVTLLIGNELVNITASITTGSIFQRLLGPQSATFAIVVSTLLILTFGEVIPKTLAIRNADRYARRVSRPLFLFGRVVFPAASFLSHVAGGVVGMVGLRAPPLRAVATEEEFRNLVDIGESEGVLELEEREMIHRVFEFGDRHVSEVMTPRTDMIAVEVDTPMPELLAAVRERIYSRVPVYDGSPDNVIGILYVKNLIHRLRIQGQPLALPDLLQPAYFVPETKAVFELFQEFRRSRNHMAIAMDEYGGVAGLVTMEDLLEELVGEIADEFDTERASPMIDLGRGRFRVSAMFPLDEFAQVMEWQPPTVSHDTIGGYVFHLFGRLPNSGEMVSDGDFFYRVEAMKRTRIVEILVVRRGKG